MVAIVCGDPPVGVSVRMAVDPPEVTVHTTSGGPADGVADAVAVWLAVGVVDEAPVLDPHAFTAIAAELTAQKAQTRIAAIVICGRPKWSR